MCSLSVLRCQVFVAVDPTVFNVELHSSNTNNDMQMSLHLRCYLSPHWHELSFSCAQRFISQHNAVRDCKIKYGVVTTLQ